MDKFSIHVGNAPRHFPGPPQVSSIGWIAAKRQAINCHFHSYNYSFIFAGDGHYQVDEQGSPLRAPWVITQGPGPLFRYGPRRQWSELFLIYDPSQQQRLSASGLWSHSGAHWPMQDPRRLAALAADIRQLCSSGQGEHEVDRLDRLCELLVFESLQGQGTEASRQPPQGAAPLAQVRRYIEQRFREDFDIDALAVECGLSTTHFRRLWARQETLPPVRYRNVLRLRQAARDLVESDAPIYRIAQGVGFRDQLYFARCFRRLMGESASAYRRRHRLHTGLHLLSPSAATTVGADAGSD